MAANKTKALLLLNQSICVFAKCVGKLLERTLKATGSAPYHRS